MARQKLKDHPVLSHKEEEDIMFGKNRARGWMRGRPRGGGSSRLKIKKNKSGGGKIMQGYKAGGKV